MIQVLFELIKNLKVLCLSIITFQETVQNMISFFIFSSYKRIFSKKNDDNEMDAVRRIRKDGRI